MTNRRLTIVVEADVFRCYIDAITQDGEFLFSISRTTGHSFPLPLAERLLRHYPAAVILIRSSFKVLGA